MNFPDVFVLTSFSGRCDQIYNNIIKPAVKRCRLTVKRADEDPGPHKIMVSIQDNIRNCRFVIANMTGLNPNVFYELGFAHALHKEVILVVQESQEKIPFDVNDYWHVKYNLGVRGTATFRSKLEGEIMAAKKRTENVANQTPLKTASGEVPSQIQHVSLVVKNWEAARDFYRDVVGLKEMGRPDYRFYGAWFLLDNGQHLHIVQRRGGGKETIVLQSGKTVPVIEPYPTHLAFSVKDFHKASERLSEHVKIIPDPCPELGICQFYFHDPSGNLIEINDGLERETKKLAGK